MKKALVISGFLLALTLPLVSIASNHDTGQVNSIGEFGDFIIGLINGVLVPVLFAVAFIVFLWGAFKTFIMGANSEEVKEQGKNLMLWGLIGFFVMVSVWGLVNILTGSIKLNNNQVGLPTADGTLESQEK